MAATAVAAPLGPGSGPQAPPAPSATDLRLQELNKQVAEGLQEIQAQRQKVAEDLKAAQKDLLDAQRKSIDWWFTPFAGTPHELSSN